MNCEICGKASKERICADCRLVLEEYEIPDSMLPKEYTVQRRDRKRGGFNEDIEA